MQRIHAQKSICTLRTLNIGWFLVSIVFTPGILLSCANAPHQTPNIQKKEPYAPPLDSWQDAESSLQELLGNACQTAKANPSPKKLTRETLSALSSFAHVIQEANGEIPSIVACCEGLSPREEQAELQTPVYRGRTHSDQKKERKPTTSSSDVLHDLWLEAAEHPFFPRENRTPHTASSSRQPLEIAPEELATKKIISSSVALLMLQKNEIETLGARSFEQKRRLWYGRQELKNDLLVYFMSIERLYPEEAPQVSAYGYQKSSRPSPLSKSSRPTEQTDLPTNIPEQSNSATHDRPASPTPDTVGDYTEQKSVRNNPKEKKSTQEKTTQKSAHSSQLKRSGSSKSLNDQTKSNACFGDNRL
ncbi:MAG: hypothetical protein U1E02_42580 [Hydrogenophaga sp.]|nr:hypothetical protein [Hydrogenophaga sp.]